MKFFAGILFLISLAACKGKAGTTSAAKEEKDTSQYFQVSKYIQGQIDEVNRTPFFIYMLSEANGKKDSVAIDNNAFNRLAHQFVDTDISDPSIKKYYQESIFSDQTTNSITLSYTANNKELPVQTVDVLLTEDGKMVKRIFIRKFIDYKDSSAIEQLSWKPGERFQVVRLLQTPENKNETSRQTIIVWNEKG